MKIAMKKHLNSLIPVTEAGKEDLYKLEKDKEFLVEIKRPRNLKHHKKLMALLNCYLHNQEKYSNVDEVLTALKYEMGLFTHHKLRNGCVVTQVKSISFSSMDQTEFEKFYETAIKILAADLGVGVEDFAGNIEVV